MPGTLAEIGAVDVITSSKAWLVVRRVAGGEDLYIEISPRHATRLAATLRSLSRGRPEVIPCANCINFLEGFGMKVDRALFNDVGGRLSITVWVKEKGGNELPGTTQETRTEDGAHLINLAMTAMCPLYMEERLFAFLLEKQRDFAREMKTSRPEKGMGDSIQGLPN